MTLQESIQIRVYQYDRASKVYKLGSTIGDSAVISASTKRQCSADSSIEIGGAYAATLNLQARITGTTAFNIRGAKLEVLSKYSTETEYKSRGTFWVTDATRVGSIYTISAQDALGWTDTSSYNDTSSAGIKGVGAALRSKLGKSGACIDSWAEWGSTNINRGWLEHLTVLTNSFVESQTGIRGMISWHWQPPGYDTMTAAEKQNYRKIWEVCNWYANSNILDTSTNPATETQYNALMYLIDDTLDEDNSTGSADSDTPRDYYKHLASLAFGFVYSRPEDGALALGQYGLPQYGAAHIGMADIEAGTCNIAEYTVELLRTMARVELEDDKDTWSSVTHNRPDYATASFQRYTLENNPFLDGFAKDFVLRQGYSLNTIAQSMWRARYQPKESRQYNIRPFSCVVHTSQRYQLGQKIQITYKREDEDTAQTYDSVITSIEWTFRGGTSLACGGEDSRVLADCTKATKADRARKEALNRCRAIERRLKSTNATMGLQKTQINSLQTQKADKSDLHTHANMDILNATEAAYTADKDKKLASLPEKELTYKLSRTKFASQFDKIHQLDFEEWRGADCVSTKQVDITPTSVSIGDRLPTSEKAYLLLIDSRYEQGAGTTRYINEPTEYSDLVYLCTNRDGSGTMSADNSAIVIQMPVEATRFIGANATAEQQGLMAPEDKAKLDSFDPTAWVLGGSMEISGAMTANLPDKQSFVGSYKNTATGAWYDVISVRHRNGYDDGNKYGMSIYSALTSAGDLLWNKQIGADKWQGVRTLLDTSNYSNQMPTKLTTENLNDSAVNGICGFFYAADGNTCSNTAVSGKPFFMFAIRISAAAKTQVAFYPHNNKMYMRSWSGSDWTAWRQI